MEPSNPGLTAPQLLKLWFSAEENPFNAGKIGIIYHWNGPIFIELFFSHKHESILQVAKVMVANKLHSALPQRSLSVQYFNNDHFAQAVTP